jgi:hypothetical protein
MKPLVRNRLFSACRATVLVGGLVVGANALADAAGESTRAAIDDPGVASAWRALRVVNCDR